VRRVELEEQNRYLERRQREFRLAADIVTAAWMSFPEVAAIAVTGSVAKLLWKEVPRFREFRRKGLEVWHECGDLDLVLWLESQDRLDGLRRRASGALREAYEAGAKMSVVSQQLDVFLFEPGTDRYLGRLCWFSECPKGKEDCFAPGCGATPFNKQVVGFEFQADLLTTAAQAMLYRRETGKLRSALDLPAPARESPS
jgi:hypothetical protein